MPEPWRGNVTARVALIDDLEAQIAEINPKLREGHADHPYIPLLMSAPGIGPSRLELLFERLRSAWRLA